MPFLSANNLDAAVPENKGTSDMIQLESVCVMQLEDGGHAEDNCTPVSFEPVLEGDPKLLDGEPSPTFPGVTSAYCISSEEVDGNQAIVSELTANSRRKTIIHKKRLSTLGITKADDEQILSQEMFVSIADNQFKRNGKGSFGTFLF